MRCENAIVRSTSLAMTDRLNVLRSVTDGVSATPVKPVAGAQDPFADFWERFGKIRDKIDGINEGLDQISSLEDEIQACPREEEADQKRIQLRENMRSTTLGADSIRQELESLKKDVENLSDEFPGSAEVRLQRNHLHVLNNEFSDLVIRFSQMQEDAKAKFARQVIRQYAISGIKLDQNSVRRIVQENPDSLRLNAFQIMGGASTAEVAQIYNEVAVRHRDILDIDRMLTDLLDLFAQFSIIVKDQGRMIDNIEQNVATAKDYVHKGVEQLELAKKDQKKARKCLWWIVVLVVGILGAIIAVVIIKT